MIRRLNGGCHHRVVSLHTIIVVVVVGGGGDIIFASALLLLLLLQTGAPGLGAARGLGPVAPRVVVLLKIEEYLLILN
jgi:hypothetical protein